MNPDTASIIDLIGPALTQFRDKKGLSIAQLAKTCYLETRTVRSYETRHRVPPWRTMERICKVLEVPLYEFIEEAYKMGRVE